MLKNLKNKRFILSSSKGFTLIELLVVIAIIGILSSVVLASLNTARGRGSDAKVKAQLSGMRAAAELYYDTNGSYGAAAGNDPTCNDGTPTLAMFAAGDLAAYVTATAFPTGVVLKCVVQISPSSAYAISANLIGATDANNDHWCVDSAGGSRSQAAQQLDADVTCG